MAKEGSKVIGNIERGQASRPIAPQRWMSPFEELDRMFDEFLSSGLRPARWGRELMPEMAGMEARMPRIDVVDRESELLVRAELPGVDKKDLDISLSENVLTIKASSSHEQKEEKGDYYRCEISRGSFARTIPLPAYVDGDKAKANFKDGILELTLPKIEQSRRRRISIE